MHTSTPPQSQLHTPLHIPPTTLPQRIKLLQLLQPTRHGLSRILFIHISTQFNASSRVLQQRLIDILAIFRSIKHLLHTLNLLLQIPHPLLIRKRLQESRLPRLRVLRLINRRPRIKRRHQILMIRPQALIIRVCVQRRGNHLDLFIKKLSPALLARSPLLKHPRDQHAAVMPRGEIAQIALDHLLGVRELLLDQALLAQPLNLLDDPAAVVPRVEIAAVEREHLAIERELALPERQRGLRGEVQRGGREEPGAVVPDPVAFGVLLYERDEELQVFFDEHGDFLLGEGQGGLPLLFCRARLRGGGLGDGIVARCELFGEDVEEEAAAVVPDGVVLWILLQEGGDLLESGVCEVAGFDLWRGQASASVQ